jgi:small GTP-binding protein
MKLSSLLRLLLVVVISLGLAALLVGVFHFTGLALQIWGLLLTASPAFLATYCVLLLALAGVVTWVGWRFSRRRSSRNKIPSPAAHAPRTEEEARTRIAEVEASGVDVSAALGEIQDLAERRAAGEVHIALFGEVSTGKSSLINALLPDCEVAVDPRAGTTRQLTRHGWRSPSGDRITLIDMPGLNEADGHLDELSREEAERVHVVLYLVDGDLTRTQHQELEQVIALGKPVILVLNKMDQYRAEELAVLRARLRERIGHGRDVELAAISAGAQREVIQVQADGREFRVTRTIPPRLDELLRALLRRLQKDPSQLEALREAAVVRLTARKLDETLATHRRKAADELISQYTKKAVVGAMAAVSPGSDLLIQGYLGAGFVRGLCDLYEVPVKEVDITAFLKVASRNIIKTLPILLAVAGNALKAFPGLGTVAGGLLHAVGYGLIFESLGRAVAASLAQNGTLTASPTLRLFEENLSDDLEARARRLTQLALEQGRERNIAQRGR